MRNERINGKMQLILDDFPDITYLFCYYKLSAIHVIRSPDFI